MKKIFLLFLSMVCAAQVHAATSVSRHGVTWVFDKDYPTGQYANGDPWVVGPVTITSITPAPTNGRNGTVINPSLGTSQGFDDRVSAYNAYNHALNAGASLPRTVPANRSVVSSISTSASVNFGQVDTFVILTVVSSAPPAGSFRPAPIGGNYNHPFNVSGINYSALRSLDRSSLSSVPTLSSLEQRFERAWYEQDLNWTGRYMHTPRMGLNGYGKDMAIQTGDAVLALNLNFTNAEKEKLLTYILQYAIDIHGVLNAGGVWYADGGHNPGRLAPLMLAAMVFDNAAMKTQIAGSQGNFQEFQQTFFVTAADVSRARYTADGRPRSPYTNADIGKPEWGITHDSMPDRDGNNWDAFYRDIGGGVLQAPAVAAIVMGAVDIINDPAFFEYAKRHIYYRESYYTNSAYHNGWDNGNAYGQGNTGSSAPFAYNETPAFHRSFYLTYHGTSSPPPPPSNAVGTPAISPASGNYISSVDVALATTTQGATIHYTTDGSAPTKSSPVYSGPIPIQSTTKLRSIAVKSGMTDSTVSEATYDFGPHSSFNAWTNVVIPSQTGRFTIDFTAIPTGTPFDGVVGLSNGDASAFNQLACIVRFNLDGFVDARNGGSYASVNTLTYQPGVKYAVAMEVDTVARTYSATVRPDGGTPVVVAENYAFRTEQAGITSINRLAFVSSASTEGHNLVIREAGIVRLSPPQGVRVDE